MCLQQCCLGRLQVGVGGWRVGQIVVDNVWGVIMDMDVQGD